MISVGYGRKLYSDWYYKFERDTDVKEYLEHDLTPSTRFNAKDYIDFQTSEMDLAGVTHNDRQNLTIETPVMLDFQNGDIIYDIKNAIKWRVTNVVIADDGQMKENSLRPRKLTRLTLVR